MVIRVPQSSINLHELIAEDFLSSFGLACKLFYPPKTIDCPNCTNGTYYVSGGPIEFPNGSFCPYCNGQGHLNEESTEIVNMCIYYDPASWKKFGNFNSLEIPADTVMSWGLMSLYPKLQQADSITIHEQVAGWDTFKYQKFGAPLPFGAISRHEVVCFWTRTANTGSKGGYTGH